ncbi:FxLYD domain-containing protein [Streptomyces sp. LE64]|uniref:FxLYD domain-containing protein n=1 Tax=unclassified Streptomyces TaxID=2593676 RepID=UPI003316517F
MNGHVGRSVIGTALLVGCVLGGAAGCSDGGSPSSTVSQAASAGADLASRAAEAAASAGAAVERQFDEIADGVDARDEVDLAGQATDADGRTTVRVTARNTTQSTRSFVVQVTFDDANGNLLDTVAVTVSDVPAGGTGEATARSNRTLSGEVRTRVERALRY